MYGHTRITLIVMSLFGQVVFGDGIRRAVVIGINQYADPQLQPRQFAVDDANEMAKLLVKSSYEVTQITDTTDKQPTKAEITSAITRAIDSCKQEDTILICLAGKGFQFESKSDAYFCPKDGKPSVDQTESLISLKQIYKELGQCRASSKVILIDASRIDPHPPRSSRAGLNAADLLPPAGVAALFSCANGEKALEHDSIKHSLFFYFVLEGLNGKAMDHENEVTFSSLSAYVQQKLARGVKSIVGRDASQTPELKANLVGRSPVLATLKVTTQPKK